MKRTTLYLSIAALAALLPLSSFADVAFNAGLVTDYRYRGISQSRLKPALQGGVDYTQGGLYLGAWASTIKWIKDTGTLNSFDAGSSNIELDLYGGYKGEIAKDLGYDVGLLTYVYPGNKLGNSAAFKKADTTEIYGALTYGPATLKYSHSLTDTFGNLDSKNSYYLDLSATFDVAGFGITPHVGKQKIKGPNDGLASYTDYSVSVSKEVMKGLSLSAMVVGTDANKTNYSVPADKFLGKSALVLGLKYNF